MHPCRQFHPLLTVLPQYSQPDRPQLRAHLRLPRAISLFLPFFLPHASDCGYSNVSFLIFEDGWDEIDIIRVLGGSTLNEMRDAKTIRRLSRLGCHLLVSGNGSYRGFSLVFTNRKDVETNSWPCLQLVHFTVQQLTGNRPLASLEIRRKSADANVCVSFLPTVAVPGSDCAIFERVYIEGLLT